MAYRIEKNYDVDYPEFSIFERCEIDGDYPDAVVAEDGEQFFDTLEDAQIALKELEKVANKEQALKAIEDLLSDPDQVSYGNGVGTDGSLYPDVKSGLETALKLLKDEKPDYNHMFDIAFTVISQKEDPYKVLPSELRAALITRIAEIDVEKGWEEAVGFCDSYEVVKKND